MTRLLSEPIESILGRLHGPPEVRRGDLSARRWWPCPFHDDRNPSLCVMPGSEDYHCFGCGAHGDAIDFMRRLRPGMSFREAVRVIEEEPGWSPVRPALRSMTPVPRPTEDRPEGWQDFAEGIVSQAEAILWSDRGQEPRDFLAGRGLNRGTILEARLGFWPRDEWLAGIDTDREVLVPGGIVIPWFEGSEVRLINVCRAGRDSRSLTLPGSHRGGIYPGKRGIVAGSPLVIVGGEFDALLLNQEIGHLAPAVTLGGAGDTTSARVKVTMLRASPWIVADDASEAGEKSAHSWLTRSDRCVRVVPPAGLGGGWGEAHRRGLDLRGFWQGVLGPLAGRSSRTLDPPEPTSAPASISGGNFLLDRSRIPDPIPCPWREPVARWPDGWRLRWGHLANTYCHRGMPCREAEARATVEVKAEREAADFGPPPVMDPDPCTALWRDILDEMIVGGEAGRHLSPDELRVARALPTGTPLAGQAIRSVVHLVMARCRASRHRALGIREPRGEGRWRCQSPYCLHKGRWWMSVYSVVNCSNCCPPTFPWLIHEEGDAEDAPHVESGRSTQALELPSGIGSTPSNRTKPVNPRGFPRPLDFSTPGFDPSKKRPAVATLHPSRPQQMRIHR